MQVYTSIAGAYPRIGENSLGHELRHARHQYDKGLIGIEGVQKLEDALVVEIIKEQERAGMDLVTDGLVRWYCPITHIAARMLGVEAGELHHYFHTNFHVRKATVRDLPQWKESLISSEVEFTKKNSKKGILAILPNPELLLRYTDNQSPFSLKAVEEAYLKALYKEAESINVPIYWEGGSARQSLGGGKKNHFQVIEAVDAFSAKEETPKEVAKKIKNRLNWRDPKPILLKPNWWLDILPRRYAYRKMEILSEVKELLLK
ncbi:MAG: hypothetical protein Q8Q89_00680 [bacterium]|nr:hypothetical protein [bacterium]